MKTKERKIYTDSAETLPEIIQRLDTFSLSELTSRENEKQAADKDED